MDALPSAPKWMCVPERATGIGTAPRARSPSSCRRPRQLERRRVRTPGPIALSSPASACQSRSIKPGSATHERACGGTAKGRGAVDRRRGAGAVQERQATIGLEALSLRPWGSANHSPTVMNGDGCCSRTPASAPERGMESHRLAVVVSWIGGVHARRAPNRRAPRARACRTFDCSHLPVRGGVDHGDEPAHQTANAAVGGRVKLPVSGANYIAPSILSQPYIL